MKQPYLILHKQLAQKAFTKTPLYFARNQLFDLINDTTEQKNIFNQTPEKAVEMQKIMKAILKKNFRTGRLYNPSSKYTNIKYRLSFDESFLHRDYREKVTLNRSRFQGV